MMLKEGQTLYWQYQYREDEAIDRHLHHRGTPESLTCKSKAPGDIRGPTCPDMDEARNEKSNCEKRKCKTHKAHHVSLVCRSGNIAQLEKNNEETRTCLNIVEYTKAAPAMERAPRPVA